MAYKDPTYVIFDGDKDQWAYRFMRGWKESEHLDFDFRDAHDLTAMTALQRSRRTLSTRLCQNTAKS
jgi:hypothetical protein